jgi:hypothetical protein
LYKIYFSVALLLFTIAESGAQIINIDKTDTTAYQKKAVWNGNVALGLEVDKEKNTLFDGSNFIDASLQKNRELFVFSSSDRFTYDGSTSFLNTGYVHLRWRHDYKAQLHPETFIQFQWDENRGMIHRYVAGGNLRYNFWHRREWEMTFATGAFYEDELWNYSAVDSALVPKNPANQVSRQINSNTYMKWEGSPSKNSTIAVIVFYQAPFSDFLSPRISMNVNFTADVSKHFSLGILYSGLYDAKPVVPIFKFYYSFANTLMYKF